MQPQDSRGNQDRLREGLSVVYEDQEGENRNTSMIGKNLEE